MSRTIDVIKITPQYLYSQCGGWAGETPEDFARMWCANLSHEIFKGALDPLLTGKPVNLLTLCQRYKNHILRHQRLYTQFEQVRSSITENMFIFRGKEFIFSPNSFNAPFHWLNAPFHWSVIQHRTKPVGRRLHETDVEHTLRSMQHHIDLIPLKLIPIKNKHVRVFARLLLRLFKLKRSIHELSLTISCVLKAVGNQCLGLIYPNSDEIIGYTVNCFNLFSPGDATIGQNRKGLMTYPTGTSTSVYLAWKYVQIDITDISEYLLL